MQNSNTCPTAIASLGANGGVETWMPTGRSCNAESRLGESVLISTLAELCFAYKAASRVELKLQFGLALIKFYLVSISSDFVFFQFLRGKGMNLSVLDFRCSFSQLDVYICFKCLFERTC